MTNHGSSQHTDVPIRHGVVYQALGRFCGWPANTGIWSWGDEILVGFTLGAYKEHLKGHSIDDDKPSETVLARSPDGGESWNLEKPEGLISGEEIHPIPCAGGINFTHPDFAMTCRGTRFYVSYDRGKTWSAPYALPDFGGEQLTTRTDHIVNSRDDCLFFLSAFEPKVQAGIQDRAFCAQTHNGGKTFDFLSWMTPAPLSIRSVMPSTVRCSETQLISALRRRLDQNNVNQNWISVYVSTDNGKHWEFLSKATDTAEGRNGNPPSMIRLKDGRIAVTYGYRGAPAGMRAKLSEDNGKTWGNEIYLRRDARTWDFGYPRTVQRLDSKIVTTYYYTTEENPQQYIGATIWDPERVG